MEETPSTIFLIARCVWIKQAIQFGNDLIITIKKFYNLRDIL